MLYRNGVFLLELPDKIENVWRIIPLYPLSSTVSDLKKSISLEYPESKSISISLQDGSIIANTTELSFLVKIPFTLNIDEKEYKFKLPKDVLLERSNEESTRNDAMSLINTLDLISQSNEEECELLKRRDELLSELSELNKLKNQIDTIAYNEVKRKLWLLLGLMGFQTGFLARWTWWDFSWDIVEPITYFITYGTTIGIYAFFILKHKMLTYTYFRNYLGQSLSDDEMRNISHPSVEVGAHVTMKFIESLGFLGFCGGAIYRSVKGPRTFMTIINQGGKVGGYMALSGILFGPVATYLRFRSLDFDEDQMYDRAYRLRYNANQVRVDRASMLGAISGYGLAFATGCTTGGVGFVVGMNGGLLFSFLYNNFLKNQ